MLQFIKLKNSNIKNKNLYVPTKKKKCITNQF